MVEISKYKQSPAAPSDEASRTGTLNTFQQEYAKSVIPRWKKRNRGYKPLMNMLTGEALGTPRSRPNNSEIREFKTRIPRTTTLSLRYSLLDWRRNPKYDSKRSFVRKVTARPLGSVSTSPSLVLDLGCSTPASQFTRYQRISK